MCHPFSSVLYINLSLHVYSFRLSASSTVPTHSCLNGQRLPYWYVACPPQVMFRLNATTSYSTLTSRPLTSTREIIPEDPTSLKRLNMVHVSIRPDNLAWRWKFRMPKSIYSESWYILVICNKLSLGSLLNLLKPLVLYRKACEFAAVNLIPYVQFTKSSKQFWHNLLISKYLCCFNK